MNLAPIIPEIEYPESDGKPMAETDVHLEWMIWIRSTLKYRYRNQRVYVGANLLVYFVEGDPHKSVAPDGFVVKDCEPSRRRTFRIWEEQRIPNVVFEVTSHKTRREDEQFKPQTYAQIGVRELFLYDPTGDYLDPMLQGFRFVRGKKTRIRADASGALKCRELGLLLRLKDGNLRMFDLRTGRLLLTEAEAQRARAKAERTRAKTERERAKTERERAKAEQERAEAADARAETERAAREAAEEEVRQLREQLARERRNGS